MPTKLSTGRYLGLLSSYYDPAALYFPRLKPGSSVTKGGRVSISCQPSPSLHSSQRATNHARVNMNRGAFRRVKWVTSLHSSSLPPFKSPWAVWWARVMSEGVTDWVFTPRSSTVRIEALEVGQHFTYSSLPAPSCLNLWVFQPSSFHWRMYQLSGWPKKTITDPSDNVFIVHQKKKKSCNIKFKHDDC